MKKILIILTIMLFPVLTIADTITATFTYPDSSSDGFRMYDNLVPLCDCADPTARTMTCTADLGVGAHSFTLTAFVGGEESPHSSAFPLVISIVAPGMGTVTVVK